MRIAYRFLFLVAILPSLVFTLVASALAIALDWLAWKLDAALNTLESKGWPE